MNNSTTFQKNPVALDISRSKFNKPFTWTGSGKAGRLIPFFCEEVLPGSTKKVDMTSVIRMTTPVSPTMDDLYCDVFYFFVPNKLTLSRKMMSPTVNDGNTSWNAIIGAQDSLLNLPYPDNSLSVPIVTVTGINNSSYKAKVGGVADCLGLPIRSLGNNAIAVSCLPFLAYFSVWNNYFRDPNLMNPITYSVSNGLCSINYFGFTSSIYQVGVFDCLPVCRKAGGYFTSALPFPQRNSTTVTLPLGDYAPLVATSTFHTLTNGANFAQVSANTAGSASSGFTTGSLASSSLDGGIHFETYTSTDTGKMLNSTNVVADLSNATAASVNQLRLAVQTQRWYEALARSGNTIGDLTAGTFGVTPNDYASDRPEYLGGSTFLINMSQVNNTASDTGDTGAFSLTNHGQHYFTKSFDTWGYIIGVMCIRPHESYHQGLHKKWTRFQKFDFYWPQFANLGEQPIYEKELYCDGSSNDDTVFGYQEAWADYRYSPDVVCGVMTPNNTDYKGWTYCNNFSSAPTLQGFLNGSNLVNNVDQTLKVSSTTAGFQFIIQNGIDLTVVEPMPTYSIPGLVDHH